MINVLEFYGVSAKSMDKKTGVWVEDTSSNFKLDKKIASIGIAVSHWVTYHGLAFNYNTGVEVWKSFNPCGLAGDIMTDLKSVSIKEIKYDDLVLQLKKHSS